MKLAVGAVVVALGGLALVLFVFSSGEERPPTSTGITLPTPTPQVPTLRNVTFQVAAASQRQFGWPADGAVRRYFGTAGSTGIDIAVEGAADVPVRAAAGGRVIFAAGNPCCEYGLTVIVDHGNGFTTLYGHLSEMFVVFGQEVKQGDWLGLVGSTGNAPVRQLHFEVRRGSEYLDPLRFLAYQERNAYSVQTAQCPSEMLRIDVASTVGLTFLPTSALEFQVESAKLSLRSGPEASRPPTVRATGDSVTITVPEAAAASGEAFRYTLETVLRQGDATATIVCTLELAYRRTLENPPEPAVQAPSVPRGPVDEPPPATASPTPITAAPTATATKTGAIASPTPRGLQGLRTPTPQPPRGLR